MNIPSCAKTTVIAARKKKLITIEEARKNRFPIDWDAFTPFTPAFTGVKVYEDFDLATIAENIDWSPFFSTWELKGKYPRIFEDPVIGVEAKKLFEDAKALLQDVIRNKKLTAEGVIGIFPANAVGDDIEVYTDESRTTVLKTFHFLRQQGEKGSNISNIALSDFIAPKSSGKADYIGGFAVTGGLGIEPLVEAFEKDHDDYNSIMIKAIADRLAEAFAERMHLLVRRQVWGYAADETLSNEELIDETYQGIRPAPGYPACPDHTEKPILFDLLNAEANTGIHLTESFAMIPGFICIRLLLCPSAIQIFRTR